jgi:hypothetical protein
LRHGFPLLLFLAKNALTESFFYQLVKFEREVPSNRLINLWATPGEREPAQSGQNGAFIGISLDFTPLHFTNKAATRQTIDHCSSRLSLSICFRPGHAAAFRGQIVKKEYTAWLLAP